VITRTHFAVLVLALSACRGIDLRGGDRAACVDGLLQIRGSRRAADVTVALDLLEHRNFLVRWTAAKNLLALPPEDYGGTLVERLPRYSTPSLTVGLEVLGRSGYDVDPAALLFLGEGHSFEIRRRAAAVLDGSPRRVEATAALLRIGGSDLYRSEIWEVVARGDRSTLLAKVRADLANGTDAGRLLARILDDPRAVSLALEHLDNDSVLYALTRTDSPAFIAGALDSIRRRQGDDRVRVGLVRALADNPRVDPECFAPLRNDPDASVQSESFTALVLGTFRRDATAAFRILDDEEDPDLRFEVSSLLLDPYFPPFFPPISSSGKLADPRMIGALLDSAHEMIRQKAAAVIVAAGLEPHVPRARQVLESSTELHLRWEQFDGLHARNPEAARRLAWKLLREGKVDDWRGLRSLVNCVVSEGRRELVDLLKGRFDAPAVGNDMLLRAMALSPRPEDRESFLDALPDRHGGTMFEAAAGLLRLGEADALPVFLSVVEQARPGDWIPNYREYSRHELAVQRDLADRLLQFLRERLSDQAIGAAILPAWKESGSGLLVCMAGRLGRVGDLVEMLNAETPRLAAPVTSVEAAYQLGYLADQKSRSALRTALAHPAAEVRAAALGSLVLLEDPDNAGHFTALLSKEGLSGPWAHYLVQGIANLGLASTMKPLAEAGASEHPAILENVADMLMTIVPEEAVTREVVAHLIRKGETPLGERVLLYVKAHPELFSIVVEACGSTVPAVRSAAAANLALLRDPGHEKILVRLLDDESRDVRASALTGLLAMESTAGITRARELFRREDFAAEPDRLSFALVDYIGSLDVDGGSESLDRVVRLGHDSIRAAPLYPWARNGDARALEAILDEWDRRPNNLWTWLIAPALLREMTGQGEDWTQDQWQEWLADNWRTFPFKPILPGPRAQSLFTVGILGVERPRPFEGLTLSAVSAVREWGGVTEEEFRGDPAFAIRDAATWRAFWRRVRLPTPRVDFAAYTPVVLLYEDPDPLNMSHFSVHLAGVAREDEKTVVCVLRRRSSLAGPMVDHAGTLWHVLLLPRLEEPVEFRTEEMFDD
jgi:HEAT repeat protein